MNGYLRATARLGRPLTAFSARWRRTGAAFALATAISICGAVNDPLHAAERSALVVDANSGKVLHSAAADAPRYPASLTKMMTLYMTFELIERDRLSYNSRIKISAQAATQPPSKLELNAGDTISVRDAVGALVTKSANDIAVALAEHFGGSESNFARLMTRKAREIGMSRTTFKNASGLPDSEQTTTARDIITLALRLQDDFPIHYKVFATRSFAFNGATHRNHNTLLYHYRGTDGIKTGYTRISGFNLVSSVRRDGRHLVAAVFGGRTAGQRNAEMRTILDRAFPRAATRRTRLKDPVLVAGPRQIKRPVRVASDPGPASVVQAPAAAPSTTAPARQATANAAQKPAASPAPATTTTPAAEVAQPVAVAPEPDNGRIKLAAVRQIGVAEHLAMRRAARAARADATQATAAASAGPQQTSGNSTATASGPADIAELIATAAREDSSPRPSALGMQVNGAIEPPPGPDGPIALANSPPATEPSAAPPGRAPSSLQEQLSRILADNRSATETTTPAHDSAGSAGAPQAALPRDERTAAAVETTPDAILASAENAAASGSSGTFQIQIGAYNSPTEAEKFLKAAQQRAGKVLHSAAPVTETVTRGDRRIYRARFAGFNSASATQACQELRRQAIDCFVTKAN